MRRTALLAGVAATALLLTACSSNDGGSTSTADKDMTAEISYAYWDATQEKAIDQIIEEFNEEYPNITVKTDVTPYSEFFGKLQTQASSDTLPDVFWMNGPNFQLYASNDKLEPVTDAVDPANYPQALNDLYSFDGTQYGVPKDYDTVAVFYNKALFDQAGVEYPTEGWTWDEFHEKAKAISDALKADGVYGTVNGLAGGQEMYYNTILQAGGEVISADSTTSGYDSPEAIAGLQFVADLIADGSAPTLQQLSDTPQNVWFVNGKSAMFWSGTWSNAELRESAIVDDIEVAPLPKDEREATVIHGLANVVAKSSKNKAAAQAFQNFLASDRAAVIQAEAGAALPAFNGTQEAFVASAPYNLQVFLDEAENSSFPYPVSKNTAAWNQLENELLPAAFSGERPVAEVAKELAEKMNEALAEENE
ncbi:ABC transporter substrate-binding protein [Agromyces italicus]|uniref:ABC transporter substrate-binding protein n=1 Tax=Agromyces italicus TaxID=279572 RepID=UPI0003B57B1A|nr:sugar ABC transporter substrate-binding protein [Agromyces italicus]